MTEASCGQLPCLPNIRPAAHAEPHLYATGMAKLPTVYPDRILNYRHSANQKTLSHADMPRTTLLTRFWLKY